MSKSPKFPPPPPAVPQFCPKLRPRKEGYYQVYGYLVDKSYLCEYNLKHNIVPSDNYQNVVLRTLCHILDQYELYHTRTAMAKLGRGTTSNIVVLANNLTRGEMTLPPQHKIDKLRELFGLEEGTEHQWFKRS